jgi:hypothetical protein
MEARNRVIVPARQAPWAGRMDFLQSIHVLLKSLTIRAQAIQSSGIGHWNRFLGSLKLKNSGSGPLSNLAQMADVTRP